MGVGGQASAFRRFTFRWRIPAGAGRSAPLSAPPPAPAPLPGRSSVARQHLLSLRFARVLEALPPVADLGRHLAALAAQLQEVVGGPESRMLKEAPRALAEALLEAR